MSSQEPADQPSPPASQDSPHELLHGLGVLSADPPTIRRAERHAYLQTDLVDDSDGSEIVQFVGSDAHEPGPSDLPYSRAVFTVEEDAENFAAEMDPGAPTNEDNSGQSTVEDDSGKSTVATSVEEAGEQTIQAYAAEDESGASVVAEDVGPSTSEEDSRPSSVQKGCGLSFIAEDSESFTVKGDSGALTVETDIKEASEPFIKETAVESEATRPVIVENSGSFTVVGDNSGAPGEVRNVYPPEPPSCAYTESSEIPHAAEQAPLSGHNYVKQPTKPIITQGSHPARPLKTVEFEYERQSRHRYEESVRPRTFAPQDIPPGQRRIPHPDQIQRPTPQRTGPVDTSQRQPENRPAKPKEVGQNPEIDQLASVKEKIYCKNI